MKIRLTGGSARSRPLQAPVPAGVRPTAGRVREALFDLVGHDLSGQRVFDAFGGSGAVALEAWSRGAEVTVAELSPPALSTIRANAVALGASLRVVAGDGRRVRGCFDGIFVDPPYEEDGIEAAAALAGQATRWLVVETDRSADLPGVLGPLVLDRYRDYGRTRLWVYRSLASQESES